jgi:hypothetical protein
MDRSVEKLAEQVFSPLVADRDCRGCTTCCAVCEIEEPTLRKPADQLCAHCVAGGCTIYETRPGVCRSFHCIWRRLAALPDELRPDCCGAMVLFDINQTAEDPFQRASLVVRAAEPGDFLDSLEVERCSGYSGAATCRSG